MNTMQGLSWNSTKTWLNQVGNDSKANHDINVNKLNWPLHAHHIEDFVRTSLFQCIHLIT